MMGKFSTLRFAVLLVAAFMVWLAVPVASAHANSDDRFGEFEWEGEDDGGKGGSDDGEPIDPGGIQADPNQWDIDKWDRGGVEPDGFKTTMNVPVPGTLGRVLGWLVLTLQDLDDQRVRFDFDLR